MAAPMMTIIKKFTYRGAPEEWSNSYHLNDHPADRAGWVTDVGNMAFREQPLYTADCVVDRALVYNDASNPATFVFDAATEGFDFAGALDGSTGHIFAGDQAATVGWETGILGGSGKMIWLRKYFHNGTEHDTVPDELSAVYAAALAAFGASLLGDALPSGFFYADKNGRRPDGPVHVDPWATTRTLKRRGKRPH